MVPPDSSGGGLDAMKKRLEGGGAVPFDVSKALAQNKARQDRQKEIRTQAGEKLDKELAAARTRGNKKHIQELEAAQFRMGQQEAQKFNVARHTIDSQHAKLKMMSRQAMKKPGK